MSGPARQVVRIARTLFRLAPSFVDFSTAVVFYLARGSAACPKEWSETFADGRAWQLDNWRRPRRPSGGVLSGLEGGTETELDAFATVRGARARRQWRRVSGE